MAVTDQPLVTLMECPYCGEPIEASKEHTCKPVDLACIISNLRSRCKALEQAVVFERLGQDQWEEEVVRDICAERDEARQWARKLYRDNADLRAAIDSMLRIEQMKADAMIDLRRENAEMLNYLAGGE